MLCTIQYRDISSFSMKNFPIQNICVHSQRVCQGRNWTNNPAYLRNGATIAGKLLLFTYGLSILWLMVIFLEVTEKKCVKDRYSRLHSKNSNFARLQPCQQRLSSCFHINHTLFIQSVSALHSQQTFPSQQRLFSYWPAMDNVWCSCLLTMSICQCQQHTRHRFQISQSTNCIIDTNQPFQLEYDFVIGHAHLTVTKNFRHNTTRQNYKKKA